MHAIKNSFLQTNKSTIKLSFLFLKIPSETSVYDKYVSNCFYLWLSMDIGTNINEGSSETNLAVDNNYLALVSQAQSLSGNLADFNTSSTWEDAVQATSLHFLPRS